MDKRIPEPDYPVELRPSSYRAIMSSLQRAYSILGDLDVPDAQRELRLQADSEIFEAMQLLVSERRVSEGRAGE